jgi:cell division protein FtsB
MQLPKLDRSRLAVGVAAVISFVAVGGLVWGLGQQVVRARQMRVEEVRLERAVAAKRAHHDDLVAQLEYVQSDAYVEQWARKDAKMARPGEVVVVVPKESGTEPVVDAPSASTVDSESQPFWVELWDLVFASADQ